MAAVTSFYVEKCCYLVSEYGASVQQRRQFLIYSRFVLEQFHYM